MEVIVQSLLTKVGIFPQVTFLVTLFSTMLVVCGKVNFTNLSRYSELNEKTYRRHFEQTFEFLPFNVEREKLKRLLKVSSIGLLVQLAIPTQIREVDFAAHHQHGREQRHQKRHLRENAHFGQ